MALETPIIATDAGGTTDLVTDHVHGLITPPGDADALARRIDEVFGNPDAAARRAAAARARVEHDLSFDARMESLESICEELMIWRGARRQPPPHTELVGDHTRP
jgi:glycosyltransferase involved in cell wall biosynthesis